MNYRQMATGDLVQELSIIDAQKLGALMQYQQSPQAEGLVWMHLLESYQALRDALSVELQSRRTRGMRLVGYNPDYVQALKASHPISTVYTRLTGNPVQRTMARCPLTKDRTPSFSLSDAKGVFHCFGRCGKSGDALDLICLVRRCSFRDAVAWLASL